MMIIDELIKQALIDTKKRKIGDVRAGLGYTGVMLDDKACGLAYTFRNELGCCCGTLEVAGSLIGMDAEEIIPWAKEDDRLKAAIGLAAINAVLNDPGKNFPKGNVLDAFMLRESDTFGMVGDFQPILSKVKTMTNNVYIFEQKVCEGCGIYPSDMIPRYLPECDAVVITATSIINHTIDDIIPYCKNAAAVCLLGPSTPLCTEVFEKYDITLLAGSVVKNPELVMQVISQGGGTMSMKPAIDQVLIKV